MFLKIAMGLLFLGLVTVEAFAAGPAPVSMEAFVSAVAKQTGGPAEVVRRRAIEVLRESGDYSAADLERISRHPEANLDPVKANDMIRLIQQNVKFRILTGLEATRVDAIQENAAKAFDQLAQPNADKQLADAKQMFQLASFEVQATKAVIKALDAKVERGNDIEDSLAALKKDKSSLEKATNDVYVAATKILEAAGVPYRGTIVRGSPVIELSLETSSAAVFDSVLTEFHNSMPLGTSIPMTIVMIDVTRMEELSDYDPVRQIFFLGEDFLQRIK